ncbi:MAG: gluconate 2-dehydrogenase subunit 3 family protein [Sulfurimonas sp.]|nr:gluconate 2-dehydrogenase subunit 3 family protein [Sulfurimonas sp.]PHQ91409.1 MAG: hypothetical protein COB42_03600 [Sulfurimonas sp.]
MKTRRFFLKTSLLSTVSLSLAEADIKESILDASAPLKILKLVQTDLFPQNAIHDSNAYLYLSVILRHRHVSDEDKQYLRNGAKWLQEEAREEYTKSYILLSDKQRQKMLKKISQEAWGRSWIKVVLMYIMEARLGDPIYGINKNETGWKWLNHEPGFPRPKEALV